MRNYCFTFDLPHGENSPDEAEAYAQNVFDVVNQRLQRWGWTNSYAELCDLHGNRAECQIIIEVENDELPPEQDIFFDTHVECEALDALKGIPYENFARYVER